MSRERATAAPTGLKFITSQLKLIITTTKFQLKSLFIISYLLGRGKLPDNFVAKNTLVI